MLRGLQQCDAAGSFPIAENDAGGQLAGMAVDESAARAVWTSLILPCRRRSFASFDTAADSPRLRVVENWRRCDSAKVSCTSTKLNFCCGSKPGQMPYVDVHECRGRVVASNCQDLWIKIFQAASC